MRSNVMGARADLIDIKMVHTWSNLPKLQGNFGIF
jgi:hypothetical protein